MFGRKKRSPSPPPGPVLRCSFCNKSARDVKKLIAGPNVQICDECVDICIDVLAEERKSEQKEELRLNASDWCAVCRMAVPADAMLEITGRGLLCPACVAAVQAAAAAQFTIRREELTSEIAQHFIAQLNMPVADLAAFLVARVGQEAVGCGALRRIDDANAEIAQLCVEPQWGGIGVGRRMLLALEQEARRLGVTRLAVETPAGQERALELFRSSGYEDVAPDRMVKELSMSS